MTDDTLDITESTEVNEDADVYTDDTLNSSENTSQVTEQTKDVRSSLSKAWDDSDSQEEKILDQKGDKGIETAVSAQSPFKIPKSWSKEASEWLTTQPKTLKEAIELRKKIAEYAAKRQDEQDADYTSKTQQIAKEREQFLRQATQHQDIIRTLEPKLQDFHLRGVDARVWLNEVLALDEMARKDKRGALLHLSKQWGVDPQDLLQVQQQNPDPIPPELRQHLTMQQQEIAAMKAALQAEQQAKEQRVIQTQEQSVADFRNAVDENGNPKYPYLEQVQSEMIPFVQMLRQQQPDASNAEILNEAYDRAVWANRGLREELLSQQQRQNAAKRIVEAKRAAAPVTSNPIGNVVSQRRSLRDAISDAWDEHARV